MVAVEVKVPEIVAPLTVGVVNVLLVNVSVVVRPTNVSVVVGKVNVPVFVMVEITGAAENVATPETVCAPENVPDKVAPLIVGVVNVLFVNVSVVALPTNVSVLVGKLSVPVLTMLEIVGLVSVTPLSVE
jgi:hypothetical protein